MVDANRIDDLFGVWRKLCPAGFIAFSRDPDSAEMASECTIRRQWWDEDSITKYGITEAHSMADALCEVVKS